MTDNARASSEDNTDNGQPAAVDDSGPCETAAYPVVRGEEGAVFFVADDEEAVSEDGAVDFDVMAGTAAAEESVAEIFVGADDLTERNPAAESEADAAVSGHADAGGESAGDASDDIGIWSRLWSRVSGGKTPALMPSLRGEAGEPEEGGESAGVALAFEEDSVAETPAEPVCAGAEAAGNEAEAETVAEAEEPPRAVAGDDMTAQAEISSDYLPGSVADLYDLQPVNGEDASGTVDAEIRRLNEALAALVAPAPALPREPLALTADAADAAAAPCVPSPAGEEAALTRRERRRRERAEKKQRKRDRKASAAADLPEIVLARSEGTESLSVVESSETAESVGAEVDAASEPEPESEPAAAPPVPAAEAADEEPAPEADAPRMSEPMSLLTPNDIIEDDARLVEDGGGNVILFSEKFHVFAGVSASMDDEDEDERASGRFLRMLPPVDGDEADEADEAEEAAVQDGAALPAAENALQLIRAEAPEEDAPTEEEEALSAAPVPAEAAEAEEPPRNALDEETMRMLTRAVLGTAADGEYSAGGPAEAAASAGDGHIIVAMEPEPDAADALAREAEMRAELEQDYQSRLDAFALRILEAQAQAAANEAAVRDGQEALTARDDAIRDLRRRLDGEAERQAELTGQLAKARSETGERESELERFRGMREEHERLYREFEDLRRAYNEVVTDVMPGLQNERDDLALTVERQCEGEKKLRSSLGSMRKRLAVGYSLGAAACLTLIALPVANWIKSGQSDREIAMERQKTGDLQETLQREVRRNIDAQNVIVELENKVDAARAQIADLQGKNRELARVSRQQSARDQGLAVFQPTESGAPGVPVRASDMALQATTQPGGRLHVNEIRDPAGSIEQVVAMNRRRQTAEPDARMAQASAGAPGRPVAMSAVARREAGGSLRPGGAAAAPVKRDGEVLAKVRKGEGVAQVVYRELGTWDPDVVAWVIRENGIQMDKRGNPRIHPDQTLRLPKDGRLGQAAKR